MEELFRWLKVVQVLHCVRHNQMDPAGLWNVTFTFFHASLRLKSIHSVDRNLLLVANNSMRSPYFTLCQLSRFSGDRMMNSGHSPLGEDRYSSLPWTESLGLTRMPSSYRVAERNALKRTPANPHAWLASTVAPATRFPRRYASVMLLAE